MTYCIGWRHNNSVYLVADSLLTKGIPAASETTSFGENNYRCEPPYVEESSLKIARISHNVAAAFSGSTRLCREIIEFLSSHFDAANPNDSMREMMISFGPFKASEPAALLIAINHLGLPKLIHWESDSGIVSENAEFAEIGSLVSHATEIPKLLSSFFRSNSFPEEQTLAALTSVIQSFGVHNNNVSQGVGGAFFGLQVGTNGLSWQRDTKYFVYDDSFKEPIVVSAFVRDDALIVASTTYNGAMVLMGSNKLTWQEWLRRWTHGVEEQLVSDDFDFWVFISTQRMLITVVYWCPDLGDCAYFRIENLDGVGRHIRLTDEFFSSLKRPLPRNAQSGEFWFLQLLDGRVNMLDEIHKLAPKILHNDSCAGDQDNS